MRHRFPRPKRLLTLALLVLSVAVGVWWLGYIPYDPLAIYRPIPASATLVGRHLALSDRWDDLLANPLAVAFLRTAGVDVGAAAEFTADEESRGWFQKLAGREGTLAWIPGRFGGPPTWMAVSHLGGESQKLRWQLSLFRVPGFARMKEFPGRPVWRVDTPDLDPDLKLVIAFGEGVILACLSENPFAIAEVLGTYDGTTPRLMEAEPSFRRFATGDRRESPDRFWLRDESAWASPSSPGVEVEIAQLLERAISLTVATEGAVAVPTVEARIELATPSGWLGSAPCAALAVRREVLEALADHIGLLPDVRHGLRMVLEAAGDHVVVAFLDGDMGGRLAWGAVRALGLAGLRVPTLLLATPVADAGSADAAIQRVLDSCNARYRATFTVHPVGASHPMAHVLHSATGREWVDALARADRPAYAVVDGWLLASSNLDALQKLVGGASRTPSVPDWAPALETVGAATAWLDLARSGKVARDGIATWSMAQMFLEGGDSRAVREQLNEYRTWIDALAPFGQARAHLNRRAGQSMLSLDLGLSRPAPVDRIPAP